MNTENLTMEEHFQKVQQRILNLKQDEEESIEYTLSKKYIAEYLKSSNLYLGCSNHRRKRLIEVDLYRVQEAFEDGFLAAVELYKRNKNNEY
jgi:hypothetical protein